MKDKDLRAMSRADLEDEVMLLRAQVKVLSNWLVTEGVFPKSELSVALDVQIKSAKPCVPPDACLKHGRCWTHSVWADEVE